MAAKRIYSGKLQLKTLQVDCSAGCLELSPVKSAASTTISSAIPAIEECQPSIQPATQAESIQPSSPSSSPRGRASSRASNRRSTGRRRISFDLGTGKILRPGAADGSTYISGMLGKRGQHSFASFDDRCVPSIGCGAALTNEIVAGRYFVLALNGLQGSLKW